MYFFVTNTLNMGGQEKVIVNLANEFSKTSNTALYSLKGNSFGYTFRPSLQYIESSSQLLNYLKHPLLLIKALKSRSLEDKKALNICKVFNDFEFKDNDVVILSAEDILYARHIKKKNPKIRIIGWIHNTYDSYRYEYFKNSWNGFVCAMNYCDTIIVLTKDEQKSFSVYHKQVVNIPNPLTIKQSKMQVKFGSKTIIWVGRLERNQKGLDYLIDIAKKLPKGYRINVAGEGVDSKWFQNEIVSNGLRNIIHLKGPLKEKDLKEHYLSGSIFLLTSRWEGFGLVITEAMNYGLPVLSFNSSGPNEIIEENQYGILVPNGDINGAVEEIQKLNEDKEYWQHYCNKSKERSLMYLPNEIVKIWKKIV